MAHGLVLRWSGCPGLSERVQCNHEVGAAKECGQPVEAKKKKRLENGFCLRASKKSRGSADTLDLTQ